VVQSDSNTSNEPKPVILDLFCGAGGMSLGFQGVTNDWLSAYSRSRILGLNEQQTE
jgi:hypothetical protein